jgi:hypothetical protein
MWKLWKLAYIKLLAYTFSSEDKPEFVDLIFWNSKVLLFRFVIIDLIVIDCIQSTINANPMLIIRVIKAPLAISTVIEYSILWLLLHDGNHVSLKLSKIFCFLSSNKL